MRKTHGLIHRSGFFDHAKRWGMGMISRSGTNAEKKKNETSLHSSSAPINGQYFITAARSRFFGGSSPSRSRVPQIFTFSKQSKSFYIPPTYSLRYSAVPKKLVHQFVPLPSRAYVRAQLLTLGHHPVSMLGVDRSGEYDFRLTSIKNT